MSDVSVAELSRQVRDVLLRFQTLAERLDNTYVTKDVFSLHQRLMDQTAFNCNTSIEKKADADDLDELKKTKADKTVVDNNTQRITDLEDSLKWAVRLVLGLVIAAVVGLVVVAGR